MSNQSKYISVLDIVSFLVEAYAFFKQKFKLIAIGGVLIGSLSILYAYLSKPIYKGHLSFFVNENESTPINLSSIAGLAGLGGNMGGGVNEDKLLFLSSSRFIVGTTMLSTIEVEGKKKLLVNHFIDKYKMKNSFKSDTLLKDFEYFTHNKLEDLDMKENKVLDGIIKFVNEGQLLKIEGKKKAGLVAQNAGIVTVDFKSIDPYITKLFLDLLFQNINTYYVNKTTQRQLRNFNLIKHRADSIQDILFAKENTGAALYDQNLNLSKMQARIKVERTRKDVEMLNLMYAEVLKNLEIAKFSLENQTPLLQVIDYPTYPLKIEKKSKIVYGLIGGIVGGFLTFALLYLLAYIKQNKSRWVAGTE